MKYKTVAFRTKLLGYFMLFTAVIFTVLWLLQTVFLQRFYNGMIIQNTRACAERISSYCAGADMTNALDEIARDNSLLVYITDTDCNILYCADEYKKGNKGFEIFDEDLRHIAGNRRRMEKQFHYRELPENYETFIQSLVSSENGETELQTDRMYVYGTYIDCSDNGEQAVLYLGTPLGAVGSAARIIRIQLLIVSILSVLVGFVLALFLSKSFSQPIFQLNDKAHTLGESTEAEPFQKGFCAELDELNETLDRTDAKLKQNRAFQNELLANVSHDLRTPLTMIKGYAEMIRDISYEDKQQCAEDVAVIVRETDRLTALVNEILEYSELQMTETETVMTNADLSGIVADIISSFECLYAKDGYHFDCDIDSGVFVRGNTSRLMRAVYNLTDNAVRHSGDDKWVGISLKQENGKAIIRISDHGAGISDDELTRIWDKYYTSRQRDGKGVSGLGLAIVKQIIRQHRGECSAVSEIGKGSIFQIELDTIPELRKE